MSYRQKIEIETGVAVNVYILAMMTVPDWKDV